MNLDIFRQSVDSLCSTSHCLHPSFPRFPYLPPSEGISVLGIQNVSLSKSHTNREQKTCALALRFTGRLAYGNAFACIPSARIIRLTVRMLLVAFKTLGPDSFWSRGREFLSSLS